MRRFESPSRRPRAATDDGDILVDASDSPLQHPQEKEVLYDPKVSRHNIPRRGERFNLADERRERSSVDKVGSGMDLEAFVREISELVTVPLSSPHHDRFITAQLSPALIFLWTDRPTDRDRLRNGRRDRGR